MKDDSQYEPFVSMTHPHPVDSQWQSVVDGKLLFSKSRLRKDSLRSRRTWLKQHKQSLRSRCATYGLSLLGKKQDLVDRLYRHLHPMLESQPGPSHSPPEGTIVHRDDLHSSASEGKANEILHIPDPDNHTASV